MEKKFRIGLMKNSKLVFKIYTLDQLLSGDLPKSKIVSKDIFVGRVDYNGKEIYENDVLGINAAFEDELKVKEIVTYYVLVRWSEDKLRWSVYCPEAESQVDWGYIPSNAFVAGNFYQNGNLLVEEKESKT